MNTQELPTEAQAYLRDAAQYIFDTYGNEALRRLTDDFDGCMKEFHEHRMEVFKKLQTPQGVAMIRELALGKIRDSQDAEYQAEARTILPPTDDQPEVVAKCGNCERNAAEELHTCPYQEDINGDYTTLCNCCVSCQNDCAGDI